MIMSRYKGIIALINGLSSNVVLKEETSRILIFFCEPTTYNMPLNFSQYNFNVI